MSRVNVQTGTASKRWGWANPLGKRDTKEYEWLVLIGEADLAYVLFLVPRADVDLENRERGTLELRN